LAVSARKSRRTPGRPRNGDATIDVRRIVTEAWALVDRSGMTGLSTRALAAALHVKSPALYWHVRNKEELLSLMVEHLLQDSLEGIPSDLHWSEWLKQVARRQRQLLLSHRDSGFIASLAPPSARIREDVFPRIMAPLLKSHLPGELASAAAGGLAALILGWVIYEQRPDTREFIEAHHRPDRAFELLLDSLVSGLAVTARGWKKTKGSGAGTVS